MAKRITPPPARKPTAPLPTVFISYRHEAPTTMIARRLHTALTPAAESWNAEIFRDEKALAPSDLFDAEIEAALDRMTHFVVLLNNSYWSAQYCRQELARAVERYEHDGSVRLLFVKAEELEPRYFTFNQDRKSGRIQSGDPVIDRVGDVQFLGPFDDQLRLVRLAWEHEAQLSDQIAQLVRRLGSLIEQ